MNKLACFLQRLVRAACSVFTSSDHRALPQDQKQRNECVDRGQGKFDAPQSESEDHRMRRTWLKILECPKAFRHLARISPIGPDPETAHKIILLWQSDGCPPPTQWLARTSFRDQFPEYREQTSRSFSESLAIWWSCFLGDIGFKTCRLSALKQDQRLQQEFAASADLGESVDAPLTGNGGAEQASEAKRPPSERSEDAIPDVLAAECRRDAQDAGAVFATSQAVAKNCDCGADDSPIAGETSCWLCGALLKTPSKGKA